MHLIIRCILIHLDFLYNDFPFFGDLLIGKTAVQKHIGQHIHSKGKILGQRLNVIAGVLLAGKRIELPAHSIHLAGDLFGGAPFCSLKQHVLDKMGNTPLLFCLVAGTHTDPEAHRHKLYMIYCFRDDTNSVIQCCDFII